MKFFWWKYLVITYIQLSLYLLIDTFSRFQTPAKTPIPAVDIVRHLLPDLIVLALSVVTLVFNALLVFNLNAKKSDTADSEEKSTAEENEVHSTEVQPLDSEAGTLL